MTKQQDAKRPIDRLVIVPGDPICGNCGNPLSKHYHEHEEFCNLTTTGDIFTDEPRESLIIDKLVENHLEEYEQIILEWKKENGHI